MGDIVAERKEDKHSVDKYIVLDYAELHRFRHELKTLMVDRLSNFLGLVGSLSDYSFSDEERRKLGVIRDTIYGMINSSWCHADEFIRKKVRAYNVPEDDDLKYPFLLDKAKEGGISEEDKVDGVISGK